jgi:predicted YcjX-like family ATPase
MENKVPQTDPADTNKKIEAIIRAVAVKHGIALGRNDPILILHTVNGLLLEEFAKQQEGLIDQFRESLESAADHWSKNMEVKADELLSNMGNSHRQLIDELIEKHIDNITLAIADKSDEIAVAHQKRTVNNFKSLNSQIKSMRSMLFVNFAASIMALVSAITMLWLLIK